MFYKNVSSSVKTFHGVSFKPGDIKEVNKYINDRFMILMESEPIEAQDVQQKKPSSEPLKKEAPKKEEPKQEAHKADPVKEEPKEQKA